MMRAQSSYKHEEEYELNQQYQILNSLLGRIKSITILFFVKLLQSQIQWSAIPEMVQLSFKAVQGILATLRQDFTQLRDALQTSLQKAFTIKQTKTKHSQQLVRKQHERRFDEFRNSVEELAQRQIDQFQQFKLIYQPAREQLAPPPSSAKKPAKPQQLGLDSLMITEVKTIVQALLQEPSERSNRHDFITSSAVANMIESVKKECAQAISGVKTSFNRQLNTLKQQLTTLRPQTSSTSVTSLVGYESEKKKCSEEMRSVRNELLVMGKTLREKPDKETVQHMLSTALKFSSYAPANNYNNLNSFRGAQTGATAGSDVSQQIATLKGVVEQILVKQTDKKDFLEFRNKVTKELSEKVKLHEVEGLVKRIQQESLKKVEDIKSDIKKLDKAMKTVTKLSQTISSSNQTDPVLNKKQSVALIKKQKHGNNHTISDIKSSLDRMEKKIQDKFTEGYSSGANTLEFRSVKIELRQELEKTILRKVEDKLETQQRSICETVEQAHQKLRKELLAPESQSAKANQTKILLSLVDLNILGRWTSTSGEKTSTGLIPWDNQIVNTMPDIFEYRFKSTNILVASGGCYRLEFAYFSVKPTTAQILVNSERVVTAASDEHLRQTNRRHPNGLIIGLSLQDIIFLPPAGKISIQVPKDSTGQAYLALYKL